jgi:hypothetical protein
MKKQLAIMGIVAILVTVGLSGCYQSNNSGVDIKLINKCDEELHISLFITGDYWIGWDWNVSKRITSSAVDVHLDSGEERSVHFDNLKMEFENQNGVEITWTVWVNSDLGHGDDFRIQDEYNATSPNILRHSTTITFHQDGTVTHES